MLEKLVRLLESSTHAIVYTGAGMSTESGLPDFRSKSQGLWERFNPDELANVQALHTNEKDFSEFYQHRLADVDAHEPHDGHQILSDWEQGQLIKGIITQNVDGFHHKAGNEQVMELHGSFRSIYCHHCKQTHSHEAYLNGNFYCSQCEGIVRPGIVLFGETLPQETFRRAEEASLQADLFIVLGSSLSVTPANMFPMLAYENGAKLVIVNREPTPFDSYAIEVIQDQTIKEVLIEVNHKLSR